MQDFQDAVDRVIGGSRRRKIKIHFTWWEENSCLSRSWSRSSWMVLASMLIHLVKEVFPSLGVAALGYAQYLPKEQFCIKQNKLIDEMCWP